MSDRPVALLVADMLERIERIDRIALYGNRRRTRGARGRRLMRQRGQYLERSLAHLYDTGEMRRTHLRGHENILIGAIIGIAERTRNDCSRRLRRALSE